MRPINKSLRAELAQDPWMTVCCFPDKSECKGRVQWHHAAIYQNRQCDERWAIIPLCEFHHDTQEGKDWAALLAITRMTSEDKANYGRRDWNQEAAAKFYKLTNSL